jgi:hypothetical protein
MCLKEVNGTTCFEKCEQLLKDQKFLALGDIWWPKF